MGDPPALLSAREAAEFLGISERSLHRLKAAGLPYVPVGRLIRYRPEALSEWAKAQETTATQA